jgi:nicotinamidase/pyrazinamidase
MKALILIDIQNDFIPGGALGVPDGDAVIAVANRLMDHFDLVVATQDWHPAGHGSFASSHDGKAPGQVIELNGLDQILWPDHCVQGTTGAEFAAGLNIDGIGKVFQKGTDPGIDSYSGFFDNGHRKSTGMGQWLKDKGVNELYLAGLATDYCVKFTALDARELGFSTAVIRQGIRAVELNPGDALSALNQMKDAGGEILDEADVITRLAK